MGSESRKVLYSACMSLGGVVTGKSELEGGFQFNKV